MTPQYFLTRPTIELPGSVPDAPKAQKIQLELPFPSIHTGHDIFAYGRMYGHLEAMLVDCEESDTVQEFGQALADIACLYAQRHTEP